jgi:hypothetical protein
MLGAKLVRSGAKRSGCEPTDALPYAQLARDILVMSPLREIRTNMCPGQEIGSEKSQYRRLHFAVL